MEVAVQMNDLHLDSNLSSPYASAPTSPRRFWEPTGYHSNHWRSAPTSPRAAEAFASSLVPFGWEERPGTPKSMMKSDGVGPEGGDGDGENFAFDFSGQLEKGGQLPDLTAADELFEKGMIRPLKPPPRLYNLSFDEASYNSLRSPKSPNRRSLWSPRKKDGEEFDPFTAAMVEATRERGRLRGLLASRSKKATRSLSPRRGGLGGFFAKEESSDSATSGAYTTAEKTKSSGGSRKWRLMRDWLLFRSASDGRTVGNRSKDPINKYQARSSTSLSPSSLPPTAKTNNKVAVLAHEKHYMSNRALLGDLKKKTPLPYRQGLFGWLRLSTAVNKIATEFENSYSSGRRQS